MYIGSMVNYYFFFAYFNKNARKLHISRQLHEYFKNIHIKFDHKEF